MKRRLIIAGIIILIGGTVLAAKLARHPDRPSPYVNAVLAVRGFKHDPLEVTDGQTSSYTVNVGEEYKITWRVRNLSEDGQILYHGPSGETGIVVIPKDAPASASAQFVRSFTPDRPGTASFVLTATGPGQDGTYTLTDTLIVQVVR